MKPWPHGALVVYLVALAFGVLTPHPPPMPLGPEVEPRPPDGLVADAIRNLLLLMPLGWMLAAMGRSALAAAGLGLLISVAIEGAQLLVPGRHTSAVDVVTNTVSAAAGTFLYATRTLWLTPESAAAGRLALASGLAAVLVLVFGTQLLRLSPGEPPYFAGWRPELGQYELYSGAILGARIGELALPIGPIVETEAFEDALAAGHPLHLEAELRPSNGATAPLFTVHDRDQDEVLLVAAQAADLLFEERTRALDLGLEQPAHRWADVLRPTPRAGLDAKLPPPPQLPHGSSQNAPTEIARIRIERSASSATLSLDGRPLGRRDWSPGRVWSLLIPGRIVPAGLEALLDGLSIALLALPCAYYARWTGSIALLFAGLLVALPQLGPVSPPRASEWLGLVAGLALARIARVVCPKIVVLTPQDRSPDSFDEEPR